MSRYGAPEFTFSAAGKVALAALIISFLLIPILTPWEFALRHGSRGGSSFLGPMFILLPITILTMYLGTKFGKMQSGDAMTLGFGISMVIALVLTNIFHFTFPWFAY